MSLFETYLTLGFLHIADVNAYDHMVFIVALCAVYRPGEWRLVAVLVTAFTVGHSVTLALATLGLVPVSTRTVEFLIPVTIFLTAAANVGLSGGARAPRTTWAVGRRYVLPLFFGLIHGLGFSSYLQALPGQESSLLQPLFAFNLGIELGQLIIVGLVLLAAFVAHRVARIPHRVWNLLISGAAAGISIILMTRTIPW